LQGPDAAPRGPRAALPRYLVWVRSPGAASDLISDSSMFSEIDCEIDSDFHFHFSLSLAHYPLMVSNLNVKRCMIDLDDWI